MATKITVSIGSKTKVWYDALMDCGIVTVNGSTATLDAGVRSAISDVHREIAGRDNSLYNALEQKFDDAWDEAEELNDNNPGNVLWV